VLRIRALGGLAVEQDGVPVSGAAAQPRRLAILAVLARAGKRGASRERLLALLWPDSSEEAGRNTLNHALYTLRRDLGSAEAISGVRELRLEPLVIDSDVNQFEEMCAAGNLEGALALYTGPFLDGFRLPGNPEFDRWVEAERDVLARRHAEVLERVARATAQRGDALGAATWWRKLAALDPLNGRVALEVMRSLAAAGDRAGALQHARIYEALLEEHLDLSPDREVVALAKTLREAPAKPAPVSPVARPTTTPPVAPSPPAAPATAFPDPASEAAPPNAPAAPTRASWWRRHRIGISIAAIAVAVAAAITIWRVRSTDAPIVAVGRIADYRGSVGEDVTASLTDMLATNLARARALRVISSARMLEMVARAQSERDTTAVYIRAARLAGATEVIEGTVVTLPTGGYRLDLRRVTLDDGTITDAETVRGADLFALADSGSSRLLSSLGQQPVAGSVADVTTRSVVAYGLYTRGLKRLQAGEVTTALDLFESALAEDSTFAMAAYWAAVAIGFDWRSPDRRRMLAHLDRAVRLSGGVSDRERLVIRTWWARATSSPTLRAVANTLSVRYPEEGEGHVQAGAAAILAGDFLGAAVPLERAIRLDSLLMSTGVVRCSGCDAIDLLIRAFVAADSLDAAERVARRAARIRPNNIISFALLAEVLDYQGRFREADIMIDSATALRTESTINMRARHWIRSGRFDLLDPMLSQHIASDGPQGRLLFWSSLSLRHQRRFDEALAMARRFRAVGAEPGETRSSAPLSAAVEAQVLLENGKPDAAAALFDSIAAWRIAGQPAATYASNRVWNLTQEASALAAAGDVARLTELADTVEALGALTFSERDRRLHEYVRGLASMGRDDVAAAIDHLERAMYSTTIGYNRTNYALAKAYLKQGRPREAIAVLRPAVRGVVLEGANLHLTMSDVHALMAQAFTAAGEPDSARVHAAWMHPAAKTAALR
jgi:DNA-binding SARP family transcriptional activator/tetratricopeptide (TPR) repeat protein